MKNILNRVLYAPMNFKNLAIFTVLFVAALVGIGFGLYAMLPDYMKAY